MVRVVPRRAFREKVHRGTRHIFQFFFKLASAHEAPRRRALF